MDATALPHGSSYWDKLPIEIKDMVFKHASRLTLFLNGRLKLGPNGGYETLHSLWKEAFDTDWQGDLKLLPENDGHILCSPLENADLARVKSRAMYERLCARFPKATEANTKFAKIDENIVVFCRSHPGYILVESRFTSFPLRLLNVPMRHMWLDLLGDMIDKYPLSLVKECIVSGHTDLLRHLADIGKIDLCSIYLVTEGKYTLLHVNDAIDVAAQLGHLDIIKMIHAAGCNNVSTKAMDMAAFHGNFDVIKWLHENRTEGCTPEAMDWAAHEGHFDIVKFLHESRTEGCTTNAMDYAAFHGHLDILKWLHENRTEGCTTKAMDCAASEGHFDIVKWLHENRDEGCTTDAMDLAAQNGYLEIVKFLREKRTEGFTGVAFRFCESTEIAEMLIETMSLKQRRLMLETSSSEKWSGRGVLALRKSLEGHEEQ